MAKTKTKTEAKKVTRKRSQWRNVWRRLCKNKLAIIGLVLCVFLLIVAVFAPLLAPYDYAKQDLRQKFAPLSWEHPFGTDEYGRDLLSRVIYGARTSLLVSFEALVISFIVGGLIGAIAGYYSGIYDGILMRLMDILMGIPPFLMAVSVSAALGTGPVNTAIAIAVTGIPSSARLIRSSIMTLKDQEYLEAATACGSGDFRILFKHCIPNCLAPLIVDSTLRIGINILAISGLSFIGLGVQAPIAEWGSILSSGRTYIRDYWPLCTFPGLAIMVTLFGFNLLGDGLRDALDPRLKQ